MIVIDITWIGQPDDGMQEQDTIRIPRRALCKFLMNHGQWVARLEGNYARIPELVQSRSGLIQGQSNFLEIMPVGRLKNFKSPDMLSLPHLCISATGGCCKTFGGENFVGHLGDIGFVYFLDSHYCEQISLGISDSYLAV